MISQLRGVLQSWWMRVLLITVALSFVISFGVGTFSNPTQVVARVDGDSILADDYQNAYSEQLERLRETSGDRAEELADQLGLRQLVLQRMINHRLLLNEARRRDLQVPNSALKSYIQGIQAFHKDGEFDVDSYKRFLAINRLQPAAYEERVREDLLVEHLTELLSQAVVVGDWEVENVYLARNEQVRIQLAPLNYKNFKAPKIPDDKAIERRYKNWSHEYMQPVAVKLEYFTLDLEDMRAELKVPDRLVRRQYERDLESYTTPGSMRARHILINLLPEEKDGGEAENKARKTLEGIAKKVDRGESFAELARKHSEGPSKTKGGDLGYFTEEKMVPSFSAAAFALKEGEVSSVVRSPFGLHLIQAVDIRPGKVQSFESLRKKIKEELTLKLAERRLNREFLNLPKRIKENSLETVAKDVGEPVRKTGWITGDETKTGLGRVRDIVDETVSKKAGKTGVVRRNPVQGHVFYRVLEVREAKLLPLEEVREQIKETVTKIKWRQDAFSQVRKDLGVLKGANGWRTLLRKYRTKAETVSITATDDQDISHSVARRALTMTKEKPFALVITEDGWIIRLLDRRLPKDPSKEETEKLRQEIQDALIKAVEASELDRLREKADIESPDGVSF